MAVKRGSLVVMLAAFAFGAFAEEMDTAYVPFMVNVAATVKAERGFGFDAQTKSIQVGAGAVDTLHLPHPENVGVVHNVQRRADAPAIISNGNGKVTVNLPAQSYKNAEVSLYKVNGKRVLRKKASASKIGGNILRTDIAAGAYLLSVKGTDGRALMSRITHGGGGLNINAAFGDGSGNLSAAPQMAKKAAGVVDWTVTVSAAGYLDYVYKLNATAGVNTLQDITLRTPPPGWNNNNCGKDGTDGSCETVTIGSQTWMAENLNYTPPTGNSWCYNNSASACVKYGRLYDWETAKTVCPNGWHLPSLSEWKDLVTTAGGTEVAGKKLKAASGWRDRSGNTGDCIDYSTGHTGKCDGTDEYGFAALPGGACSSDGSSTPDAAGIIGIWWTATHFLDYGAYNVNMYYGNDGVEAGGYNDNERLGYSVRCVKNE
jgi:uncharacterized protein (TIGR02145 family)